MLKKIFITAIMLVLISGVVSAQRYRANNGHNGHTFPKPHGSGRPSHWTTTVNVAFDAASTVLTVSFPSNSQGGNIEVFRDGAKVTGITANGGTTFSCTLRDYGTGNYHVIVSSGNTVIDNKNYTVK